MERHYHHLYDTKGNLLLADPCSAKAKYGLTAGEYLHPASSDFLDSFRDRVSGQDCFLLSHPSSPVCYHQEQRDLSQPIGADFVAVEMRQTDGFFFECAVYFYNLDQVLMGEIDHPHD